MSQLSDAELERRADAVKMLRLLADNLEKYHYLPLPCGIEHGFKWYVWKFRVGENEVLPIMSSIRKLFPGQWDKNFTDSYMELSRVGGFPLKITTSRSDVCTPKVVGKKVQTVREYGDAPYTEVSKEVDIIEWDCPPSLAGN